MRRLAQLPVPKLRDLIQRVEAGDVPKDMTVAEGIALVMLRKALTDYAWGDKTREDVLRRLDGEKPDVSVEVAVGVLVRYVDKDT